MEDLIKKFKNKDSTKKQMVLTIIVAVLLIIAVVAGRELYFFMTESSFFSNEKYTVKGIDVSKHQLEINWKGVASQGFDFAYIKATQGTNYVDPYFEKNWEGARKYLFRVGAYHFLSFDTDGETQADTYIRIVPKKSDSLPPVVDVEFYGKYRKSGHHPSKDTVYEKLDVVLKRLEQRYDKRPVIYTNNYVYNTYISGRYTNYDIWISDQSMSDYLDDGSTWTFCQYTFKGRSQYIGGGKKYFDADVFRGTKYQLRHYKGK